MRRFLAATVFVFWALGSLDVIAQTAPQLDAERGEIKPREQTLNEAIAVYSEAMEAADRQDRRLLFERAYLLFQKAASADQPSAALLTNQGNAALQAGQTGPAIAAYRQALACDPGYRRAQANLAYARSTLPKRAMGDDDASLVNSLFFWNRAQPSTIHLVAAAAFLLAAIVLAGTLRWSNTILRNLAIVPALIWLLLIGSAWATALFGNPPEAVVIVDEVIARSADSATAAPRLTTPLPNGTELVVLEDRGDWLFTQIANNQSAWLPASSVARVPSRASPPGHFAGHGAQLRTTGRHCRRVVHNSSEFLINPNARRASQPPTEVLISNS